MTYEEALKQLYNVDGSPLINDEPLYEGIDLAKEAVYKQIPRNPLFKIRICNKLSGICPSCFKGVNEEMTYCCNCGQHIDWSYI